jgi:hypothetical protein
MTASHISHPTQYLADHGERVGTSWMRFTACTETISAACGGIIDQGRRRGEKQMEGSLLLGGTAAMD